MQSCQVGTMMGWLPVSVGGEEMGIVCLYEGRENFLGKGNFQQFFPPFCPLNNSFAAKELGELS